MHFCALRRDEQRGFVHAAICSFRPQYLQRAEPSERPHVSLTSVGATRQGIQFAHLDCLVRSRPAARTVAQTSTRPRCSIATVCRKYCSSSELSSVLITRSVQRALSFYSGRGEGAFETLGGKVNLLRNVSPYRSPASMLGNAKVPLETSAVPSGHARSVSSGLSY